MAGQGVKYHSGRCGPIMQLPGQEKTRRRNRNHV